MGRQIAGFGLHRKDRPIPCSPSSIRLVFRSTRTAASRYSAVIRLAGMSSSSCWPSTAIWLPFGGQQGTRPIRMRHRAVRRIDGLLEQRDGNALYFKDLGRHGGRNATSWPGCVQGGAGEGLSLVTRVPPYRPGGTRRPRFRTAPAESAGRPWRGRRSPTAACHPDSGARIAYSK